MGFLDNLGGKEKEKKTDKDIFSVVEILSTNIESVNQQLSNLGLDPEFNSSLKDFLPNITKILKYLTQEVQKLQKNVGEMHNNMYTFEKNNQTAINNMGLMVKKQSEKINDFSNKFHETQDAIKNTVLESNETFSKLVTRQNAKMSEVLNNMSKDQEMVRKTVVQSNNNFSSKLEQMVDIHLQEIKILKDQHNDFVSKMTSFENVIRSLGTPKSSGNSDISKRLEKLKEDVKKVK